MADQQAIQLALDPNMYAITAANAAYDEEVVTLLLVSGNQGRQFQFSPKHAKRLMLLLEKQLGEYEAKFGELKTELPQKEEGTTEKKVGF